MVSTRNFGGQYQGYVRCRRACHVEVYADFVLQLEIWLTGVPYTDLALPFPRGIRHEIFPRPSLTMLLTVQKSRR